MNLATMEQNRGAVVIAVNEARNLHRLQSSGLRPGASIELIGRTSSRGLLVKVDDTRLVLSRELAEKIDCSYD